MNIELNNRKILENEETNQGNTHRNLKLGNLTWLRCVGRTNWPHPSASLDLALHPGGLITIDTQVN